MPKMQTVLDRPRHLLESERSGQGRIIQVFQNADLRYGLPGLTEICKKHGILAGKILRGHYVVFINSSRTMVKVIASGRVLAQIRREKGERIDLQTISLIPYAFMANGKLSYDDMLVEYFKMKFKKGEVVS